MADDFCLKMPDFHLTLRGLLHAVNLRHGTNGFTSLPKEGVLRIFSPWKIRRLRPGLNPRTWVPKASTLPLDHRSRCVKRNCNISLKNAEWFFCCILFRVSTERSEWALERLILPHSSFGFLVIKLSDHCAAGKKGVGVCLGCVQIAFLQLRNQFFFVLLVIKTGISNEGERNCFSNTPL